MKKTTELKHLTIGYQRVGIVSVDREDRPHVGCYSRKDHKLYLINEQNDVEKANTVIHESLHALWYTQGLKEWVEDENLEEPVVNAIANGLTQVFRDNPKLFDWLKERLNG